MKKISYLLFVLATFFIVNLNGQNTFPSSGYVGIGTTSPSEALHLKQSEPQINLERTNSSKHCDIYFRSSSLSSSTPLWAFGMMGTSPNLRVWTWNGSSQSVRFTIKTDGNVGIGTTNPTAKLQVSGTSYLTGDVRIGGTSNYWNSKLHVWGDVVVGNEGSGYNARLTLMPGTGGGSEQAEVFNPRWNGAIVLKAGLSDNREINYMKLVGDGSRAIVTVYGKLEAEEIEVKEIQGNIIASNSINAKKLNLQIDNVADYVFEEDYNLRSLEEVETYVKKEKHLPEIPSASEMETEGMNVAEMNNLLLKKVEELTLYIISQEKRITELESQISK